MFVKVSPGTHQWKLNPFYLGIPPTTDHKMSMKKRFSNNCDKLSQIINFKVGETFQTLRRIDSEGCSFFFCSRVRMSQGFAHFRITWVTVINRWIRLEKIWTSKMKRDRFRFLIDIIIAVVSRHSFTKGVVLLSQPKTTAFNFLFCRLISS